MITLAQDIKNKICSMLGLAENAVQISSVDGEDMLTVFYGKCKVITEVPIQEIYQIYLSQFPDDPDAADDAAEDLAEMISLEIADEYCFLNYPILKDRMYLKLSYSPDNELVSKQIGDIALEVRFSISNKVSIGFKKTFQKKYYSHKKTELDIIQDAEENMKKMYDVSLREVGGKFEQNFASASLINFDPKQKTTFLDTHGPYMLEPSENVMVFIPSVAARISDILDDDLLIVFTDSSLDVYPYSEYTPSKALKLAETQMKVMHMLVEKLHIFEDPSDFDESNYRLFKFDRKTGEYTMLFREK